jgi:hypothetical protein
MILKHIFAIIVFSILFYSFFILETPEYCYPDERFGYDSDFCDKVDYPRYSDEHFKQHYPFHYYLMKYEFLLFGLLGGIGGLIIYTKYKKYLNK